MSFNSFNAYSINLSGSQFSLFEQMPSENPDSGPPPERKGFKTPFLAKSAQGTVV